MNNIRLIRVTITKLIGMNNSGPHQHIENLAGLHLASKSCWSQVICSLWSPPFSRSSNISSHCVSLGTVIARLFLYPSVWLHLKIYPICVTPSGTGITLIVTDSERAIISLIVLCNEYVITIYETMPDTHIKEVICPTVHLLLFMMINMWVLLFNNYRSNEIMVLLNSMSETRF